MVIIGVFDSLKCKLLLGTFRTNITVVYEPHTTLGQGTKTYKEIAPLVCTN